MRVVAARRRRGRKPALAPEALAFQDELDALVAEPAPLGLRLWPALAGGLVLALLLAAGLMRIDVVVTGQGRLMTDAPPVVLQPMDRAVLRELRVKPGDRVREGDVLAVLDPTFTEADREALAVQRATLAAQLDRLEAERAGRLPPLAADAESELQFLLLARRLAFRAARQAALEAELRSAEAALETERSQAGAIAEKLAVAREVESMRTRLMEGQVGSRLNLLSARVARLEAEQDQRRAEARLQEAGHRLAARRADREAFLEDWQRGVMEELVRVRADLARVDEQLAKARRLEALTLLRAPRDGVVLEHARRAPGSLVAAGEPVVVLVPADVPLIAEVNLRSSDVGRLGPGDAALVKIDAFPWRRHGAVAGRLRAVSRDSVQPEGGGGAFHRAQIELGAGLSPQAEPIPGMTLNAEIKVGTRSVLGFFLEPLIRGLQESLREP